MKGPIYWAAILVLSLLCAIACEDKIINHDTEESAGGPANWNGLTKSTSLLRIEYISPVDGKTGIGSNFQLIWTSPMPGNENHRYISPFSYYVFFGVNFQHYPFTAAFSERYLSPWGSHERCGELLQQIYSAQQSYRQLYGTYCLDGGVAAYDNDPDGFAVLGISLTDIDYYDYVMVASEDHFCCRATANLDDDAELDWWSIYESGELYNDYDDLLNLPFLYDTEYHWQIVTVDAEGREISGPVWSFTTVGQ